MVKQVALKTDQAVVGLAIQVEQEEGDQVASEELLVVSEAKEDQQVELGDQEHPDIPQEAQVASAPAGNWDPVVKADKAE